MHSFAIFLSSLFMCSTVFASSVTSVSLGELSSALNERMLLMPAVAGYKAQHHLPVEDLSREKVVIDSMRKKCSGRWACFRHRCPFCPCADECREGNSVPLPGRLAGHTAGQGSRYRTCGYQTKDTTD